MNIIGMLLAFMVIPRSLWHSVDDVPQRERRDTKENGVADRANEVQLGAQGRIVIPAFLRKTMNLNPGDRLIARVSDDGLLFERREHVEKRLWEMFDAPADCRQESERQENMCQENQCQENQRQENV